MPCFCKVICKFLLTCFIVHACKISDKSDKFLLNYSALFRGPLFSRHSVVGRSSGDNKEYKLTCATGTASTRAVVIRHTAAQILSMQRRSDSMSRTLNKVLNTSGYFLSFLSGKHTLKHNNAHYGWKDIDFTTDGRILIFCRISDTDIRCLKSVWIRIQPDRILVVTVILEVHKPKHNYSITRPFLYVV